MGESYLAPANGKTLTDAELALVNQRLEKLRSLNAELDRHQQMWNELSGKLSSSIHLANLCIYAYFKRRLYYIYLSIRPFERSGRLGSGGRTTSFGCGRFLQ